MSCAHSCTQRYMSIHTHGHSIMYVHMCTPMNTIHIDPRHRLYTHKCVYTHEYILILFYFKTIAIQIRPYLVYCIS